MSNPVKFNTYTAPGGNGPVWNFPYLLDTTSGVFRPFYASDFAVSASVSVNAVAITGSVANVAITGVVTNTVTGWNTGNIVRTQAVTAVSTSNSAPSGVAPFTAMTTSVTGRILAANSNRIMWFVQNIHTGLPLYVNMGEQAASTGTFSFILNPSSTTNWGGSSFSDDRYRGAVTVSGGAWNGWEM